MLCVVFTKKAQSLSSFLQISPLIASQQLCNELTASLVEEEIKSLIKRSDFCIEVSSLIPHIVLYIFFLVDEMGFIFYSSFNRCWLYINGEWFGVRCNCKQNNFMDLWEPYKLKIPPHSLFPSSPNNYPTFFLSSSQNTPNYFTSLKNRKQSHPLWLSPLHSVLWFPHNPPPPSSSTFETKTKYQYCCCGPLRSGLETRLQGMQVLFVPRFDVRACPTVLRLCSYLSLLSTFY